MDKSQSSNPIGIIGGTGLDDPQLLESAESQSIQTPYGNPSSPILCGTLAGRPVAMLSRHGREHTIPPTQVNNRANIYALKELGCQQIVVTAACGSLRAEMDRGHFVIPDQFIDFTRHRALTFFEAFEPGVMNARHAPMADPFDGPMRATLVAEAHTLSFPVHDGGTILTIEGNRFSTRAESNMFRAWGADLVNMTVAPECILANELGLRYAAIAVVTDFDCWKTDEPPLRVEDLVRVFKSNVARLSQLLLAALPSL
jgi:5'-methylthioadenosine phosphorylase